MSKQAMELALKALKSVDYSTELGYVNADMSGIRVAIAALEEAINRPQADGWQQQGEPVAWMQSTHLDMLVNKHCGSGSMLAKCSDKQLQSDYRPLYTSYPTIREGWQMVPKELDANMQIALERNWGDTHDAWYAALATAPQYTGEK